ncbi:MAG: putative S-methyl-5'-thioinosine phosphorylase [Lysobacteraceae bacterium]|nr:MAG: putative S-methyl-5'-thioinosine phosphorylase [Xanthomonadaceae bacterium]
MIDLGIIGGTGASLPDDFIVARKVAGGGRYGEPSAPLTVGSWHGRKVAWVSRHGGEVTIAPHNVNYRANIWALHKLKCKKVIALNSVGGITSGFGPLAIATPKQLIDYTWGRSSSFSDVPGESVQHIDFSHPYDETLRHQLLHAGQATGVELVDGGVYAATQGPRLETVAEIARLERDGCDIVGMTGMPEAYLAREVGIAYASLAMVANWAAGKAAGPVDIEDIYTSMALMRERCWQVLGALASGITANSE